MFAIEEKIREQFGLEKLFVSKYVSDSIKIYLSFTEGVNVGRHSGGRNLKSKKVKFWRAVVVVAGEAPAMTGPSFSSRKALEEHLPEVAESWGFGS